MPVPLQQIDPHGAFGLYVPLGLPDLERLGGWDIPVKGPFIPYHPVQGHFSEQFSHEFLPVPMVAGSQDPPVPIGIVP